MDPSGFGPGRLPRRAVGAPFLGGPARFALVLRAEEDRFEGGSDFFLLFIRGFSV
jgi:hypothetical protein